MINRSTISRTVRTSAFAPAAQARSRGPLFVASLAGVLATSSSLFAADLLSIKAIAPQDSILVVGVDDFAGTRSRFDKTPIGAWWNSKEVQDQSKSWREEMDKGLEKMTQELGVPRDTITWPASMGAALYAQLNEETGAYDPALIFFVDWGAEAEKFGKLYDAAVAKMEKESADSFKVEEIKGRRVYVAHDAAAEAKPAGGEEADPFAGGGPENPFARFCFTRDGGRFVAAGSPAAMQDLLDAIEGGTKKNVTDNEDFRGSLELGGGRDMYATILTAPAQKLLATLGPEVGMVSPFLSGLFGDIRGFSMGLTLDGETAPVESTVGVFVPGKKMGLLSLFPGAAVAKLPSIIPSEAISYSHVNFNFGGLMKVVDDFVASLPPAIGDQLKSTIEPFDPVVRGAFGGMGSSMDIWGTLKQPITAESGQTTMAVSLTDAAPVQKLLQTFGPMAGLEPRDFVGNTIYSTPDADEFSPMQAAFGLGGSYLFMGGPESVENAMRALGQADAASSLANDPTYKAVQSHWSGSDLVAYGYTNTAATMEAQEAMFESFAPMLESMAPEGVDDMPVNIDAALSDFVKVIDPKVMKNYFGPSVWDCRSVEKGFRFNMKLLPVAK